MDKAIVPAWVYSFADYRQIFDLREQDLHKKILDFPGGISSFNAEMQEKGYAVLSGDRLYAMNPQQIIQQADDIYTFNEKHLLENKEMLQSQKPEAIDSILKTWDSSKQRFLNDFDLGKSTGRYKQMDLPHLPFKDHEFNLALCSDFLFHSKTSVEHDPEELIHELCRVAEEVRVFPLMDELGKMPKSLGNILISLQQKNYGVEIREVPYKLQKGGNAMLRIWAKECEL